MCDQDINSWMFLPYPVLFNIYEYLDYKNMVIAGQVCKRWHEASMDDLLWKKRFFETFIAYRSTPLIRGKQKLGT